MENIKTKKAIKMKKLAYWHIDIKDIKNNVEGFLAWLLWMHEVAIYAIHKDTLIIRVERQEEELERLKKDAESLGIMVRENE